MKRSLLDRLQRGWLEYQNRQRIQRIANQVAVHAPSNPESQPLLVMNVSSRLTGLSQNNAFTLLTAWGLRLAGIPVVHFVCQSGMSHCVLGVNRQEYHTPPPCEKCVAQSLRLYAGGKSYWFKFKADADLVAVLKDLDIGTLSTFEYRDPAGFFMRSIPLGKLALPAMRWTLRRYTLPDDESTRYLFRQFMLSAFSIALEFNRLIDETHPFVALIFNGIMYPEAMARWVANQRGVRVITHEVGFQRFSSFFTDGEATAYPVHIPESFELTSDQETRLDSYLEGRFKGKFTMAGIRFWPEMKDLDEAFLQKAANFKQIVPVFTNVIYDTSQVHANTLFEHMFAWLDGVQEIIKAHPETLFIIRAHPDEMRPGTAKQSRESVHDWVFNNRINELPNVVFIDSQEFISSYELIQRSKFIMVYNSSIGLEAALMGAAVLCAGKARYTQYPIVFLPQNEDEYHRMAKRFLVEDHIEIPPDFQRNARRFLYYQLYRISLPFETFLQTGARPGFVRMNNFNWEQLLPQNAPAIKAIFEGITENKPFMLEELR
ncbi:MAG: hypothetical protein JW908_10565 [Anaerolineales bacterium]|nr:hypothetical protein [Anaerolineales bacterium]